MLVLLLALAYPLDMRAFQVLRRDSGPQNYYRVVNSSGQVFIRGVYEPPLQTVTLVMPLEHRFRRGVKRLRWRWRALELPRGGNECIDGSGDSAAAVYVSWKSGLKWYSLKLVWSTDARRGATCNVKRSPFVTSDSIVLETGGGGSRWIEEDVDIDALFRQHFGNDIPELQGIGLLTDGDQTRSLSVADYADFVLYQEP